MKKFSFVWVLTVLLSMTVLGVSGATEIREEKGLWKTSFTQQVESSFFVIDKGIQNSSLPVLTKIHTTFFQIGSYTLNQKNKKAILESMSEKYIGKEYMLRVVGHTCRLGEEDRNYTLSLQRAKAVYDFLLEQGFNVNVMEGKGSSEPLTKEKDKIYLNRRVEIFLTEDGKSSKQ